jgi:hypothetical protein
MVKSPINRRKFLSDLRSGKKMEEYVAHIYKENFFTTCDYITYYPGKEYDISFSFPRKDSIHIEVKYDKYANKSGNLCFEMSDHKGRPSGIMATKAHLMVFILNKDTMYEFKSDELRKFIQKYADTDRFKVVKGGDGNAFEMMLVPISEIIEQPFCTVIEVKNENL